MDESASKHTVQSLREMLDNKPDWGIVNGWDISKPEKGEMSTKISGNLYNRVLAIGLNSDLTEKGKIAQTGLLELARQLSELSTEEDTQEFLSELNRLADTFEGDGTREFRAIVVAPIIRQSARLASKSRIAPARYLKYALVVFANHPGYSAMHDEYISYWGEKSGGSTEQLEQAQYDYWKKIAITKRLNLVSKGDPDGQNPKMSS